MAKLVHPVQCDPSLPDLTRGDASDVAYVQDMACALLEHFVPEYQIPDHCVFRFHRSNQTCALETNIDFEKANAFFRRRADVSDATLTPGAAVGAGLSVGDSFLVDKLVKGWKPNQFVNGPLKEFVKR